MKTLADNEALKEQSGNWLELLTKLTMKMPIEAIQSDWYQEWVKEWQQALQQKGGE